MLIAKQAPFAMPIKNDFLKPFSEKECKTKILDYLEEHSIPNLRRDLVVQKTLTPFGFQSEQRTYWSDTDLYIEMSPFTHVKSLAERRNPILLIHGQNDDNTGTFPIQSER